MSAQSRPCRPSRSLARAHRRALLPLALAAASLAQAQALGGNLISYSSNIILFLGVGAVVVALVGGVFRPELAKTAVYTLFILVIIFFILHNTASLQAAVL